MSGRSTAISTFFWTPSGCPRIRSTSIFKKALERSGLPYYCLLKQGNGATQSVSRWLYDKHGHRADNITEWALEQFREHYEKGTTKPKQPITKDAIFNYVYGVLHDPVYREKYSANLKRDLPRIPFYADFWKWAGWGERLMNIHIDFRDIEPWPLRRINERDEKSREAEMSPAPMLRVDKDANTIRLDSETVLADVPEEAWAYRLANRSAIEWVIDQYKEFQPKDPIVREKFNTYRYADYKESVVELLMRVVRVSVETVAVIKEMEQIKRR